MFAGCVVVFGFVNLAVAHLESENSSIDHLRFNSALSLLAEVILKQGYGHILMSAVTTLPHSYSC